MHNRTREQHLAALRRGLRFAKRQVGGNLTGSSAGADARAGAIYPPRSY